MNRTSINLKLFIIFLIFATIGWFQLGAATQQNGNSNNVPITIFKNAIKHIPSLEKDTKKVVSVVSTEFQANIETGNYHRLAVDAIDEDLDGTADYLFVYFMPKTNFSLEVSRLTVGKNYEIIMVENDYTIQPGDSSTEMMPQTESCNCPDNTVDVLVSSCETGIPTAVAGVNYVYDAAVAAGYNAHKLLGSEENSTNIDNWLCCPNLKFWGRIGHGLTNAILLDDGNLSYTYFDGLGAGSLTGKVLYWNSCQVFNNPMKASVLATGAGKFMGGICNLYIGSSEEVFKAWADKNFNHVSAPAGTTDEMCYWLTTCESTTGYPEPGCHGCGGPDSIFPYPGTSVTYVLATSTAGQGTISLSPATGPYAAGTVVTVTANPASGWVFNSWGGDLSGSTNPTTITMDGDKAISATFIQPSVPPVAAFTGAPTTVVAGNSVTFTDQSTNGPTSWSWSFPGGTPSTSTVQNPQVTYNTAGTYSVELTVTNAQGSDTETKVDYITVINQSPYCSASGDSQEYEWIAGVAMGGVNNASGASGYTDFTNLTAAVNAGDTVNITLTPGFAGSSYSEYWRVWIDYNADGDFEDTGEQVYSGSGTSTRNGSFTVPSTASGLTRMRVAMRYNAYPSSCGTFDYGEVEDYSVNITGAVILPPVAQFTANNTTILAGESVTFTDQSTNNPTSWAWTFTGGNPAISTSQNVTVAYSTPGVYTVTLTVTNSAGNDSETKTNYITVEDNPIEYCTVSGNSQSYEWIAGVTVGSLTNTSGASGYTDFTAQTVNVNGGSSVSVSLTPGFGSGSYSENWVIWIDYNKDGDFQDSGEQVFSGSSSSTVNGSFTVPSSAIGQTTRMRIGMRYGSNPPYCGTFDYGEVEDYTINIQ